MTTLETGVRADLLYLVVEMPEGSTSEEFSKQVENLN